MKKIFNLSCFLFFISSFLFSCSVSKQINKQAKQFLFADSAIMQGHIGISVFDPSTGKYLYNHNADKYFIPASNTKLFSWYAGMKYLGDSLVGLKYYSNKMGEKTAVNIIPTGDPTFLSPEFKRQPVYDFLSKQEVIFIEKVRLPGALGNGWAWNDHTESYMTPRSSFPFFANTLTIKWINKDSIEITPSYFNKKVQKIPAFDSGFYYIKEFNKNDFIFLGGDKKNEATNFNSDYEDVAFLEDQFPLADIYKSNGALISTKSVRSKNIFSQPSDSLFKPMMHRSDNFFAEQTLLMASNEYLGYMSDRDMIDTILKTSLKDLPQKPRWVDGSGLSRYNLFTPQSFVWLLNKTKNEFDWERIKNILPTGGEGTLSSYYKDEKGFIYAKTGTLSNNCALSGYLITKKNKLLIFSVLVNNYPTSATPVRRAVEKFIKNLREKY